MMNVSVIAEAKDLAPYFLMDSLHRRSDEFGSSIWWGEGANRLGLSGSVGFNALQEVLSGFLPNGVVVRRGYNERTLSRILGPLSRIFLGKDIEPSKGEDYCLEDCLGMDLTFSAPRSVTLIGLISGDSRVLAAHQRAVKKALGCAQSEIYCRIDDGKYSLESTRNILVASFEHHSTIGAKGSPVDPYLHTRCAVVNATQRHDLKWSPICNSFFYREKSLLEGTYLESLEIGIRSAGYGVQFFGDEGHFEIAGFSKEKLDEIFASVPPEKKQVGQHIHL